MEFTIIGLLFDIVGAWLLAYEFIWGFNKRMWAKNAKTMLVVQNGDLNRVKEYIDKISSPPYTKEELDDMKVEADEVWKNSFKTNEDIIQEAGEKHQNKSIIIAMLGIVFLTIGFSLQIVGTITSYQSGSEKQTGVEMENVASTILKSNECNDSVK